LRRGRSDVSRFDTRRVLCKQHQSHCVNAGLSPRKQSCFLSMRTQTSNPNQQVQHLQTKAQWANCSLTFGAWAKASRFFQPKSNQTKEDRIIRLGGRYVAVQIKSGRVGNARNGSTIFTIWAGNPHTGKKRKPCDTDADVLVMVGMDYAQPSLHNSFGVFVPWSGDLQSSIVIGGPVGVWPTLQDVEQMFG
jgi:hypothetical protein